MTPVLWLSWFLLGVGWAGLLYLNHRLGKAIQVSLDQWAEREAKFIAELARIHGEIADDLEAAGHSILAERLRAVHVSRRGSPN